jgi:Protein of unknown function (DUF2867)
MRVPREELRGLHLEADAVLGDVPLHDVSAVDLAGGGRGRTISDVRALLRRAAGPAANPLVRALFALRSAMGRLFGWDSARHVHLEDSYVDRVSPELRRRSLVAPGTPDGPFRQLFVLEHESLAEIQNATVHAFLAMSLVENERGYRLYWGIYVKPVSRLTGLYMELIEPFRRFIVYPILLRQIKKAWAARYP